MTENEVLNVARESGLSDPVSASQRITFPGLPLVTFRPYELDFVDVLFQNGKAIAVQRGNYVSFTTGMEFGSIRMLCEAEPPAARTLRDFARALANSHAAAVAARRWPGSRAAWSSVNLKNHGFGTRNWPRS